MVLPRPLLRRRRTCGIVDGGVLSAFRARLRLRDFLSGGDDSDDGWTCAAMYLLIENDFDAVYLMD